MEMYLSHRSSFLPIRPIYFHPSIHFLSLRRLDPPLLNISIRGCHTWTSSNNHSFKSSNESLITVSYPRWTELLTTDGVNLLTLVLKKPLGNETLPKLSSFLKVKGDCLSRDKGATRQRLCCYWCWGCSTTLTYNWSFKTFHRCEP